MVKELYHYTVEEYLENHYSEEDLWDLFKIYDGTDVLHKHHEAWHPGYVSRVSYRYLPKISKYHGKFGVGFVLDYACGNSTRYHVREYYIYDVPWVFLDSPKYPTNIIKKQS